MIVVGHIIPPSLEWTHFISVTHYRNHSPPAVGSTFTAEERARHTEGTLPGIDTKNAYKQHVNFNKEIAKDKEKKN